MSDKIKLVEKYIGSAYEAIVFLNQSFYELSILNQNRKGYELEFLKDMFFIKYHYAMKGVFILEYCKLLETDTTDGSENIASLAKLNWKIKSNNDKTHIRYNDVSVSLLTLLNTDFYKKIKKLRDKKVAHSGNHFPTFNIPQFSDEELADAKLHVEILNAVFKTCTEHFQVEYPIHNEDSTERFITEYSNYWEEFDKNNENSIFNRKT
ncbi:hypothetical protein [Pedobacter sp. N23S346]|uniref:hypothetical protein n=1 Tax=Pedobacter sp. N23S346 TaxID=3402750 RepID=UPI003AC89708